MILLDPNHLTTIPSTFILSIPFIHLMVKAAEINVKSQNISKIVLVLITNPGISYIVVLRVSLCNTINHNDPIVIFTILVIYDPTDPTMIFITISPKKTHPMTTGPSDHIHL